MPFARQLDTTPQTAFALYGDVAKVETPLGVTTHTGDESAFYIRLMERLWTQTVQATTLAGSSFVPPMNCDGEPPKLAPPV